MNYASYYYTNRSEYETSAGLATRFLKWRGEGFLDLDGLN